MPTAKSLTNIVSLNAPFLGDQTLSMDDVLVLA